MWLLFHCLCRNAKYDSAVRSAIPDQTDLKYVLLYGKSAQSLLSCLRRVILIWINLIDHGGEAGIITSNITKSHGTERNAVSKRIARSKGSDIKAVIV